MFNLTVTCCGLSVLKSVVFNSRASLILPPVKYNAWNRLLVWSSSWSARLYSCCLVMGIGIGLMAGCLFSFECLLVS